MEFPTLAVCLLPRTLVLRQRFPETGRQLYRLAMAIQNIARLPRTTDSSTHASSLRGTGPFTNHRDDDSVCGRGLAGRGVRAVTKESTTVGPEYFNYLERADSGRSCWQSASANACRRRDLGRRAGEGRVVGALEFAMQPRTAGLV